MFRILSLSFLFLFALNSYSQVGIGNVLPQSALDVSSSNNGVLIPRVALTSTTDVTTVESPNAASLVESTLVYNTGAAGLTEAGFYYWENSQWNMLISSNQKQMHIGRARVTSAGALSVTGVGFRPITVEFIAINRIENYNSGAYRSGTNNSNDLRMAGGFTTGYARDDGASIEQQAIASGFSGSSLNNIGAYSSSSHCIAAFYVNNNGEPIHDNGTATGGADAEEGLVRASLQSFDTDGFTLNFDRFLPGAAATNNNQLVIIYKAYRY
tara:strand:- start:80535 stop:81341 length:807 start_codon:yes stop_codon:yes gene_type:complete